VRGVENTLRGEAPENAKSISSLAKNLPGGICPKRVTEKKLAGNAADLID